MHHNKSTISLINLSEDEQIKAIKSELLEYFGAVLETTWE